MSNTANQEVQRIVEAMSSTTTGKFKEIREIHYNPNVKGGSYEVVVREFLANYLGGRFEFYNRCSLLDTKLHIHEVFSPNENEWDVVGTFRSVVPQVVLERAGAPIIPYDATALIVAVKQTLSLENLAKDLERYNRLRQVQFSKFGLSCFGDYSVGQPMRLLFYYEGQVGQKQKEALLNEDASWDLLISFSEQSFVANRAVPLAAKLLSQSSLALLHVTEHALPWLLLFISASLPFPLGRNTGDLMYNLLRESYSKYAKGDSLETPKEPRKV